MGERYTRLFSLSEQLYIENAPVIITAGALLKDNKTDNILVQLIVTLPNESTTEKFEYDLTDVLTNVHS